MSKIGKEATIGIRNEGDFFGKGCLTRQPLRLGSATAMTDCCVMKIEKKRTGTQGISSTGEASGEKMDTATIREVA